MPRRSTELQVLLENWIFDARGFTCRNAQFSLALSERYLEWSRSRAGVNCQRAGPLAVSDFKNGERLTSRSSTVVPRVTVHINGCNLGSDIIDTSTYEGISVKSAIALLATSLLVTTAFAASSTTEKLPSGVVVEHLVQGTGPKPTAADVVRVNYRGTLANGTEFDSSAKHGGPAEFPLGRVIPCWTQGLQKVAVGGKAKLTCPAATAYGDRGVGTIPPNSDLTFEVELLAIVK